MILFKKPWIDGFCIFKASLQNKQLVRQAWRNTCSEYLIEFDLHLYKNDYMNKLYGAALGMLFVTYLPFSRVLFLGFYS